MSESFDKQAERLHERADDVVDAWHDNRCKDGLKLHEVMGMTHEEYDAFVTKPDEWARKIIESGNFKKQMTVFAEAIRK